jgi:hypothetical protein
MADLSDKDASLTVKVTGADTLGAETNFLNVDASGNVGINDGGGSITVDATSLPLPTGASTSALQTTGNTTLGNIDTKTPPLGQTTMAGSTPVTIASNQTRLPVNLADGAGNLLESSTTIPLDTSRGLIVRSINEEPATFSVWSISTALGNNKHMLSIMNNTGSGVVIKLKKIKVINSQTTAVTGVITDFRGFRITSLTAGTALTPQTFDTNDTLNGSISCSTGGTVGGLGTVALLRALYSSDEWGSGTLDKEGYDQTLQTLMDLYDEGLNQKPITLRPGQGFTIQCVTNTTAGTFDIECVFTQEA